MDSEMNVTAPHRPQFDHQNHVKDDNTHSHVSSERRETMPDTTFGIRFSVSQVCLLLCVLALAGCAASPEKAPEAELNHWSITRSVPSKNAMVTLFDPLDLAHHEGDPEDWYRYDFAFANDLETGRFAAVMSDKPGNFLVRLTSGPLSTYETQAAGPRASMRLRVINHRLLLSGGDAWPSRIQRSRIVSFDPRWIAFENGDYRVIITALDRQKGARHDFVFQLLPVDDILSVSYAPGIPYLVMGEAPGVVGIQAGGLSYREACARVPDTAVWSPLTSSTLPLPGSRATINIAQALHRRGNSLQVSRNNASLPIVVARNPVPGALGLFIQPDSWETDASATNGEVAVSTRVLCAVTIKEVVPGNDDFELRIEPLPGARDPLTVARTRSLNERFENWVRLTSDPAWRYKSAQIQRTVDHRSRLLGIMDYLDLSAKHSESLLQESNGNLANRLLDHMSIDSQQPDH
ncbi:MAG: hypothetical protein HKN43_08610 [Rhodothermales bacterium]|nr:hypothetical protein [Rhodothermales bacterium]